MPKARKTFKETVEQNPITSIVLVASATVASTFGVMTYFHQSEEKLRQLESDRRLAVQSQESEKKIGYLEGRLASIERKVGAGTPSYFDVTSLLTTSDAIRGLDKNFTFFGDLNCYIAIPTTEQWSHEITNELRLMEMMIGPVDDPKEAKSSLEAAKLHLWKGPDRYDVNTGDDDVPVLHLFPFVFIQSFENSELASLMGKAITERSELDLEKLLDSVSRLNESLDQVKDEKGQTKSSEKLSTVPANDSGPSATPSPSGHEAEKLAVTEMLDRIFRSDLAGFILLGQLAGHQQFQSLSKECSVHLVSAEKKGNVLYCNFHITMIDAKTKIPIYWDKEIFFVSGARRSFVVATSAPSTDRRSPRSAWITTWLSSLRIPIE